MNPTIALAGNQVETHAPLVMRRTAAERLVLTLTALGMIASLAAFVSYEEAISTQLKEGELFASDLVKSQVYYVVYGIQLILFTAAGVLAFLSTEWRTIERGYLLRFALFLGAALLMSQVTVEWAAATICGTLSAACVSAYLLLKVDMNAPRT